MSIQATVTRKVGPLPVWAWAALAVVAWFLFLRGGGAAAQSTSVPVGPSTSGNSSAAQEPASGQGTPADNLSGDLLSALLGNQKSTYDALLASLQYGGVGGVGSTGGVPPGFGSSGPAAPTFSAAATDSTTAPTVVGDGAPVGSTPSPYIYDTPPAYSPTMPTYIIPATATTPTQYFQPPGYFQNEQGLQQDFSAYDAAMGIPSMASIAAQLQAYGDAIPNPTSTTAVTAPTPYAVVQPAPVDTKGVIEPTPYVPRGGKMIAV